MWLATTRGFYSAVQHRETPAKVMVRARSKADLESLVELAQSLKQPIGGIVETLRNADYPYRVEVNRHVWQTLLVELAEEVTYDNFKNAVAEVNASRANTYHNVWQDLLAIEKEQTAGVSW